MHRKDFGFKTKVADKTPKISIEKQKYKLEDDRSPLIVEGLECI